jgi:hypothetical protein
VPSKVSIFEIWFFDPDGELLGSDSIWEHLGHRPAFEHGIVLKTEIKIMSSRMVFLDYYPRLSHGVFSVVIFRHEFSPRQSECIE